MDFSALKSNFKGEVFTDNIHRIIYATDASAYREMPLAVCVPEDNEDIRNVIAFAHDNGLSIIPRASGTSIAGQIVRCKIFVQFIKNNAGLNANPFFFLVEFQYFAEVLRNINHNSVSNNLSCNGSS